MAKFIKDENGKFAGSIGDGKNNLPTVMCFPVQTVDGDEIVAPENTIEAMYARLGRTPTPSELVSQVLYEGLDVIDVERSDPDPDDDNPYQPVYEVYLAEGVDTADLALGEVQHDLETDEYVTLVNWSVPRTEPDRIFGNMPILYAADISRHATKEEALESIKREMARRVPMENEFRGIFAQADSSPVRQAAAINGFTVTSIGSRRHSQTANLSVSFRSEAVDGRVPARNGYVTIQPDGTYLGVVRYAGSDLNKETNPTPPIVHYGQTAQDAFDWVAAHLASDPASYS